MALSVPVAYGVKDAHENRIGFLGQNPGLSLSSLLHIRSENFKYLHLKAKALGDCEARLGACITANDPRDIAVSRLYFW